MGSVRRGDSRAAHRRALGHRAESLVCEHMERLGYEVIARNARVGRLELDIVARRGRLLVFCEVRALTSDERAFPSQTVGGRKAQRVRQAAAAWMRERGAGTREVRLDVASVVFDTPEGRLTYLEGAL